MKRNNDTSIDPFYGSYPQNMAVQKICSPRSTQQYWVKSCCTKSMIYLYRYPSPTHHETWSIGRYQFVWKNYVITDISWSQHIIRWNNHMKTVMDWWCNAGGSRNKTQKIMIWQLSGSIDKKIITDIPCQFVL
jgi:hypothetical protein